VNIVFRLVYIVVRLVNMVFRLVYIRLRLVYMVLSLVYIVLIVLRQAILIFRQDYTILRLVSTHIFRLSSTWLVSLNNHCKNTEQLNLQHLKTNRIVAKRTAITTIYYKSNTTNII
jgi:hypothetical protein